MNRHNDDPFMSVNECTDLKWPQNSREKLIMRYYNGWPVMNPVNYRKYMFNWMKGSLCRTRSRTYSSDHWKRISTTAINESMWILPADFLFRDFHRIFTGSDFRSNRDDRRQFWPQSFYRQFPVKSVTWKFFCVTWNATLLEWFWKDCLK